MKDKKITVTGVNTDVLKFYDKHPNGGYQSATVELDIWLPLNSSLSEAESIRHKSFLMLEVDVIDKYKHMKEINIQKSKERKN